MPKASEKRRSHRTRNGQIRQDHAFEESARPVAERNEPKRYEVCRLPQVTLGINPLFLARNSTDQSLFGGTERDLHYNDHTSGAGFQMVQAVDNQKPYHVGHPFPKNNPTQHEDTSTWSHTIERERGTSRWCFCNKEGEYEDLGPICEKCLGHHYMGPGASSQMNQEVDHHGIQTPSECYRMPVSHKHSNDWTQHPTTSSDAPSSLFRPHPSERSRLMRGNAYFRVVSLQHRGPLPVNKQRVTPTGGQYPIVFGSSRGTDWPNLTTQDICTTDWQFSSSTTSGSAASVTSYKDEFSSHGQEGVGDTHANRGLTSSEMVHSERGGESLRSYGPLNDQHKGSFAPVSLREAVQSQGTDFQPSLGVGDLNMNRPSHGDTQANRGLTSSVHSERREESLRSHGPFNYQLSLSLEGDAVRNSAVTKPSFGTSTNDVFSSHGQQRVGDFNRGPGPSSQMNQQVDHYGIQESLRSHGPFNHQRGDSFASVSLRHPSLVPLEQQVAEIDRFPKEREERTKKQREAPQRHRDTRSRKQRELPQRHKDTRSRKQRESPQRHKDTIHQTDFSRFEKVSEGNKTQAASPSLEVRPLAPPAPCEHYQRRCTVKFPCCGVFYPCERCHNSEECPDNDMKAHHATHVKCGNCEREEEINEESQTCRHCGAILSEYFCPECKFFMGVNKNPFHCEKCEICRLNKDKSFHCDVCNFCMEKQLEGKHKCRPDSGHEVCPICREDVFTGGLILLCSHKIHEKCLIGLINSDYHNCPICGLSLYGQLPQ